MLCRRLFIGILFSNSQEARRLNIAQYQHMIMTEFLPKLLGPQNRYLAKYGLLEPDNDHYDPAISDRYDPSSNDRYDPSSNGQVLQEFAGAAFRVGHTFVPSRLILSDAALLPLATLSLAKTFNEPSDMQRDMKVIYYLL